MRLKYSEKISKNDTDHISDAHLLIIEVKDMCGISGDCNYSSVYAAVCNFIKKLKNKPTK